MSTRVSGTYGGGVGVGVGTGVARGGGVDGGADGRGQPVKAMSEKPRTANRRVMEAADVTVDEFYFLIRLTTVNTRPMIPMIAMRPAGMNLCVLR
jgi:hypothetical protein